MTPILDAPASLPLTFRAISTARGLLRGPAGRLASPLAPLVRAVLNRRAPNGHSLVRVSAGPLTGARMYVDLTCEKYYWLGTHEEEVQRMLADTVRPGFVAYDAGAHAGFFTLLLSRLVTESGRVHAFEPRPENVERLRATVRANHAQNVDIHPVALNDHPGEAAFVMSSSTLQGALAADGIASAARVWTDTIDGLVRDGMTPPDIVKIDVEGTEGAVIRGAERTIELHRPLLLIEVHSQDAGREVMGALPCPYEFRTPQGGRVESMEIAGHYLACPANDGGIS